VQNYTTKGEAGKIPASPVQYNVQSSVQSGFLCLRVSVSFKTLPLRRSVITELSPEILPDTYIKFMLLIIYIRNKS